MVKVTKINATVNPVTLTPLTSLKKRRVAAYARVSTDSDEQFTSFEAQKDYYTKFILNNPDWEMVDVYTDEGISGTNTKHREGFKQMIKDAIDGKIDLIVTKSVSRFARNTVDSLTTIRELKAHNVEVFFEKENIYTFDSKGELLITIMSSLAQEESRSISENVTWGVRKGFQDGKFSIGYKSFLGYEKGEDGRPKIVESEAKIIKLIYTLFLDGYSVRQIADELNERGLRTPTNKKTRDGQPAKWNFSSVMSILKNEKYKGEAILQKTYTTDFLTHETRKNNGELPQYHVKNSHEAIIPVDEWEMVQFELERRSNIGEKYSAASIFSSKIVCGDCGHFYGSKVWHSNDKYRRVIYQCNEKFHNSKKCGTPHLTEEQIKAAFIKSFNSLDTATVIDDCLLAIEVLKDTTKLDEEEAKLNIESKSLIEVAKGMIQENATTTLDQDEYRRNYQALEDKHNGILARLKEIDKDKKERLSAIKRIELAMAIFTEQDGPITEFNRRLWNMLVKKVVVTNDNHMKFIYYTGIENSVEIG